MPYGQPDYSSYNIPSSGGLYDFLGSSDQSRMNMSGSELASSFGYSGSEYGDYFNQFDTSSIDKTMGELPELQKFLQGNVREGYNSNKQGLLGKVGQTGMAGTGSFNNDFSSLNSQFGQQMFGADKQIQDIISQLKGQITEGAGNWRNSLMSLLQGGAEKGDDWMAHSLTRPDDYDPSWRRG